MPFSETANKMDFRFAFRRYSLPFRAPVRTARGIWRVREGLYVRMERPDGSAGCGEAAPIPSAGTESVDDAEAFCRCLGERVDGQVLSRVPAKVGDLEVPAGTTVMLVNAAANRDPRRFDDPATFDITRENARHHMAFGRGVHTCPGAPLARTEARVSLERLLDRTADIRIDESHHGPAGARRYHYVPTFILRGLTRLYLEFTPAEDGSR